MKADPLDEEEIHALIGKALLASQSADRVIKLCLTVVIQKEPPLTWEKLQTIESRERRQTLGYFLSQLRARASLRDDFDSLLDEYLNNRNTLVHNVSEIPGWNLNTDDGRRVAGMFVTRFAHVAIEVLMVFAGLLRAWQVENLLDAPLQVGHTEMLDQLDSQYVPQVNKIFSAKE